jgi:predicted DNA-binding transcriptional regulator AlpA
LKEGHRSVPPAKNGAITLPRETSTSAWFSVTSGSLSWFLFAQAGWDHNQLGLLEIVRMVNSQNGSARVFYTVSEVSEMFGISRKSVYRLLYRGILKSSTALRHKMISRSSVEGFLSTANNGGVK